MVSAKGDLSLFIVHRPVIKESVLTLKHTFYMKKQASALETDPEMRLFWLNLHSVFFCDKQHVHILKMPSCVHW